MRFIPTLVGNASRRRTSRPRGSVHPHARGERICGNSRVNRSDGSSPRSWGTLTSPPWKGSRRRFIPTLVGNAPASFSGSSTCTVHPHARGERVVQTVNAAGVVGSSPRSWGTPCRPAARRREPRFIPTLVGNARHPPSADLNLTVHPHARGERPSFPCRLQLAVGSSPRSWGTLAFRSPAAGSHRFIPTLVGNAPADRIATCSPTVHPHARGERDQAAGAAAEAGGSSPRSWGTPWCRPPDP